MFEESAAIVPSIWESIISWFTPTILFILLNLMIATILFTSNSTNNPSNNQDQKPQNEHQNQPPKLARSPSVLQRIKSFNFYPYKSQETPNTHFKSNQDFPLDQTLESAATQYIFNQVLEHHSPNSLTHFSFEHTHHQETTITNIENFDSALTHYQENQNTNTHFVFEQTHHQESIETSTQFVFDQTHVEKSQNEQETEEFQSMDDIYSQLKFHTVARTTSDTKPASGEIPKRLPEKMKKSASMKSAFSHFEEEKIVERRRPATTRERQPRISEEDDGEVDAKADDFINKFKNQLKLQRIDSIIRYKDTITRGSGK